MSISEFVIFKLNGEFYGVDINNVENIERKMPITRVPYTKNFIKGVVNLRGNVIPVIDLRTRFGIEYKEYDDESRILIINHKDYKVGMIADSSSEVLQLEETDINEAPSIKNRTSDAFIKSIGKNDGRIIMLIDLIKVLGLEEEENE
ncbi:MAG: chemotaxis protein CheW [Firmicutes bacterium]|jgi:purine-binding chemotaxis protein CheW|nr:chemotaxis protein CheW [Bacillota bacterium]